MSLAFDTASRFARIALANVVREFPGKPDHVLGSAGDARPPRAWHPAFYGSFDWHSCVHMHWLLARVRRLHPRIPERDAIGAVFDAHLTERNVAAECAYLARPESQAFERTYGWAWLLELAHELARSPDSARWQRALAPLADAIAARYLAYLPRQRYPLRHGLHANSAFGIAFAIDYARASRHDDLASACLDAARRWFAADRDAPVAWGPSGADFLSPSLMEAEAMRRVLSHDEFGVWFNAFLPGLPAGFAPFVPALVDDRSDPFIVHLDGLNLSRAWCMSGIARALPQGDPRASALMASAGAHLAAGLDGVAAADYAGSHWLATFATLAMTVSDALPTPGC